MKNHTPTPWRAGDAGLTVFGPPNGNPSPETVAYCRNKANTALIVEAANQHEALIEALTNIFKLSLCPEPKRIKDWSAKVDVMADYARQALKLAGR